MFKVSISGPAVERFFSVRAEAVMKKQHLFLGEAIRWIASRGAQVSSGDVAARWEEMERELFDAIDAAIATGAVVVEGVPEGAAAIYEPLPTGIWATMNTKSAWDMADGYVPQFVEWDRDREIGGQVSIGQKVWNGVRLPSTFVLERWPEAADTQPMFGAPMPKASYALEDVAKHLEHLAAEWLAGNGPRITTRKWRSRDGIAAKRFPGISSKQCDEAWKRAKLPPAWKGDGARGRPRTGD
jgi:hypothetical protein